LKGTATLGSLRVGGDSPVRVMAAINVSPESFYKGSVATAPGEIAERAKEAVALGADLIDIGAMSTAPYLKNEVTQEVEADRVVSALRAIEGIDAVVSVDTMRSSVAEAALKKGASVINDVSGLKNDKAMGSVVKRHGASLLAMAHSPRSSAGRPVPVVQRALRETLRIAGAAGIPKDRIVLDPGIGFFREEGAGRAYSPQRSMTWADWDVEVLAGLRRFESLGLPVCVGLSRKSFIGKVLKLEGPEQRLIGSVAATAVAVMNGADLVRTHDVAETVQCVRMVEAVMGRAAAARRDA
jgi:dihydropteroate synthase